MMKYASDGEPVEQPDTNWSMAMVWHDLLFMHWPVDAQQMCSQIPDGLTLDTYEGQAWIGVVPFRMSGIRHRWFPPLAGLSAFPELNVRTYVTCAGQPPGVWFFSLDAAHKLAVHVARWKVYLPYFEASMSIQQAEGRFHYQSRRTHAHAAPARFEGEYFPTGEATTTVPGTLDHWLTARYCLYSQDRRGGIWRGVVDHMPWRLQTAAADVTTNTMTDWLGIQLPDAPPLLHFADRLDVVAWRIKHVM